MKKNVLPEKFLLNLLKHDWDYITIKFPFTIINAKRAENFVKIHGF